MEQLLTYNNQILKINNSAATIVPLETESITINNDGVYTAPTGIAYNSIIVDTSGGDTTFTAEKKAVNFRDYDGTIRYSYTAAEFANLTTLPENPCHTGLTAQGWNWTLSDAKEYVNIYGGIDIGQHYTTTSGDTELDIFLEKDQGTLYLALGVIGSVTINWGDGTTNIITGSSSTTQIKTLHTWPATEKSYTIIIHINNGSCSFYSPSNSYPIIAKNVDTVRSHYNWDCQNVLRRVRIGNNFFIKDYAFYMCRTVETITIPSTITSFGQYSFSNCDLLNFITFPSSLTSIPDHCLNDCLNLKDCTFPKNIVFNGSYNLAYISFNKIILTNTNLTTIPERCCNGCYVPREIILPDSVTAIDTYAFSYCYSMNSITLPSNLTTLGTYAFDHCYNLTTIIIPNKVTSIPERCFNYCYKLQISFANSSALTSIGTYAFYYCSDMTSITLPNTVTSIGTYSFRYSGLTSITIPANVTSIGTYAFANCTSLQEIHFLGTTTTPTFGSNCFYSLPTTCKIYVPTGYLSTYQGKSNAPSSSTYTWIEE